MKPTCFICTVFKDCISINEPMIFDPVIQDEEKLVIFMVLSLTYLFKCWEINLWQFYNSQN